MKHKDFAFEIKAVDETGTFSGYGSVYGVLDDGDDIVAPGCFTDSLADYRTKGRMPALLWQHDSDSPCGVYLSMEEDDIGLRVEGKLALKTQIGAEAYELMQMKAISGLSIGYVTREDSWDQKTGIRTIKKADLWECSLVTFPMNDKARVSSVKSIEEINDFKSVESYLRDAGSLSRTESKALIARIKSLALRDAAADEEASQLIAALGRRTELIKS
jgi:hypothetical protein